MTVDFTPGRNKRLIWSSGQGRTITGFATGLLADHVRMTASAASYAVAYTWWGDHLITAIGQGQVVERAP